MAQSLVNDADQCGAIPHWVNDNVEDGVMPGDAGSLIVAGAYAFGARAFDTSGALKHTIRMANVPGTACNGVTTNGGRASYLQYGYVTNGEWRQASSTLEYASSDFAISQFAGQLGNSTIQTMLLSRSAYWQNLLDTSLTPPLVAARNPDGSWIPETQSSTDNYVEGNAEQYAWMVPFEAVGLFGQRGGNTAAVSRLDTLCTVLNAGMSLPNLYGQRAELRGAVALQLGGLAAGHAERGPPDHGERLRHGPERSAPTTTWGRVGMVRVGRAGSESGDSGCRRFGAR
jgi:putative alpha-1,2-mannosidase